MLMARFVDPVTVFDPVTVDFIGEVGASQRFRGRGDWPVGPCMRCGVVPWGPALHV